MIRRFVVILLLIGSAAPMAHAQDNLNEQTFFLTFVPNVQFSPLYVAQEKGYFAEAGFDLSIEHGDEPVGVDLIAANERQFGMISGEQVIAARANDRPVVFVYEWFQQYPVGVVVPAGSDIETVDDLRGRRLGIPGRFGASYSGLIALLTANNLTETDVQLEEIGFNAPEVVCIGAIEASVIYVNNEPLQIAERAAQGECGDIGAVDVLPVAVAADMVSNGIVTNEETIANHPEWILNMNTAFERGLRDVINNPAEAYLISAASIDNLPLSPELDVALQVESALQADFLDNNPDADRSAIAAQRSAMMQRLSQQFDGETLLQLRILLATIELWDADQLGSTEPASWELTQDTLITMGFIDAPIELDAAYTNDFLPASSDEE